MKEDDLEVCQELIIHLKKMMESYEEMITIPKQIQTDYNRMLLWAFQCLKEAETGSIRFEDAHFVDREILRLENKIYYGH